MAKPRKKKSINKSKDDQENLKKNAAATSVGESEAKDKLSSCDASKTPQVTQRRSRRSMPNAEAVHMKDEEEPNTTDPDLASANSAKRARSSARKVPAARKEINKSKPSTSHLSKDGAPAVTGKNRDISVQLDETLPDSSVAETQTKSKQMGSASRSKNNKQSKAKGNSKEALAIEALVPADTKDIEISTPKPKGVKDNSKDNASVAAVIETEFVTPKSRRRKSIPKKVILAAETSDESVFVTPKAQTSTPLISSEVVTPKEPECITPKSKPTPRDKKSSVKSLNSKKSKAKSSRNDNDLESGDSSTGCAPMDTGATPKTPANQVITEKPETGETSTRSRRSAAIRARKSFQAISKMDDFEDDVRTKKRKTKKSNEVSDDDDSDADPDVKLNDGESSSEDSDSGVSENSSSQDSEDSYTEEDGQARARGFKKTRKPECEMPYFDSSDGHLGATINAFYKFFKECERSKLFYNWRPKPSHWKHLSTSKMEPYIPFMKTSLEYSMGYSNSKKQARSERTLDLFESESQEYKMCFTGGPIRAMNWCPVSAKEKQAEQVLAVYAVHHPDFRHSPQDDLKLPSLIQLWNFGSLKDKPESLPVMSCGLAVDYGPIHELKWCPFGAYDNPQSDKETEYYTRLGLLAVAAWDGFVYIYSIPHLHQLQKDADAQHPIFQAQPVAKLVPSLFESKGSYGPCICMDWQWTDSAVRLFAGFGAGQIAVWQLDTQSPLLLKKSNDGVDLLSPIVSFCAHREIVTGISICKNVPDYFSTVSHDSTIKVWDLKRPEALVNQQFRYMFNFVLWPPQYSSNMVAQDYGPGNYWMLESGYFGSKGKPIVPHMDACWHIDYNPWLRAGATVDGDGVVAITLLPNLLLHRIHSGLYRHSCYIITAKATIDEESEEEGQQSSENQILQSEESQKELKVSPLATTSSANDDTETNNEIKNPSSANNSDEESGSTVMDTSNENANGKTVQNTLKIKQENEEHIRRKCRPSFEKLQKLAHLAYTIDPTNNYRKQNYSRFTKMYHDMRNLPIQAMYRNVWNPNIRWRTWLAFGGQAGILGVVNLHWHDDRTASKICKDIR